MTRRIDESKCIGCGECVADCVIRYIFLKETEDGKKIASFTGKGKCMECGHCNAVCPEGAITGGERLIEPSFEPDDLLKHMSEKRTIRRYRKGAHVSDDALEKIIFAAQTAPSGRNKRTVRIVFVKEGLPDVYGKAVDVLVEDAKKAGPESPMYPYIMGLDRKRDEILWDAEYLVVLSGKPDRIADAVIAAERMQLEATNLGVGTAYRGDMRNAINNSPELKEILGIKENEQVQICFAMGIPDVEYPRSVVKKNKTVEFM